jgi:nicotinate-nucleotide pyrophosphorylase (carboxylating)
MTASRRNEIAISVGRALIEDLGDGDVTAALVEDRDLEVQASVTVRENAVLCGIEWFDEVYRQVDPRIVVDWQFADGDRLTADDIVCRLTGPVQAILTGERTALNFLQTLSGTATLTRRYVDAIAGSPTRILDTRKTIPGLRRAQKYAVACGGGNNHRIGLFDAFLIKENHIEAVGSLPAVVDRAAARNADLLIEVEVENLDQVAEALATPAQRLMLDNFSLEDIRTAVAWRNERAPDKELEASGNIRLDDVRTVAATGVDWISIGAITKDIAATDYSLRVG